MTALDLDALEAVANRASGLLDGDAAGLAEYVVAINPAKMKALIAELRTLRGIVADLAKVRPLDEMKRIHHGSEVDPLIARALAATHAKGMP